MRVEWYDDGTGSSCSKSKSKDVQYSTYLEVPTTKHYDVKGSVDFKITNKDDEDYPYIHIYVDGDKKGYVSASSGQTRLPYLPLVGLEPTWLFLAKRVEKGQRQKRLSWRTLQKLDFLFRT